MSALIKQASEHWRYVAPLLTKPTNEAEYDVLVAALDELLAMVGDDEDRPLASLASSIGSLLEAYDESVRPMPKVSGAEALRYLMQEHQLAQSDLPEIGTQSVVSEILGGRRQLNVRHIRALSKRFNVPVDVFF
ncbi:type II toxin-antitoxin system HigA family antitoxin [Pseudomonas sp. GV071]|uniref:helix-turn-helix domain-containing protein n=1 Tax=Pseudomonas sp. GV071 TaxID=2135754 RepID=UPI000D33C2A1|nr:transcriptional regulator [Pseudomonas sp. GV071]PTQ73963.1 HTH-type transcriptional regulator/antitoxin HigA [Pseudomonas sp. GV071]